MADIVLFNIAQLAEFMNSGLFGEVEKIFSYADDILIITHRKPDGDACGSALALSLYFQSLNKRPMIFSVDSPPSYFDFLPAVKEFTADCTKLLKNWDLIFVLDCGDWEHSGLNRQLIDALSNQLVVNIDHHFTNVNFGSINIINHQASSTSEIIFDFLRHIGFPINKNIATCLLCGLITDTGALSNAATSPRAIRLAGQLVAGGANIKSIVDNISRNKTIGGLRLWGLIFSRLKINDDFNCAYTYILESELMANNIHEEEIDGFVNFLNNIAEVDWAIFFRINSDHSKVSLRTTKDKIDVSRVASFFGGGGHKKAAGFTLAYPLTDVSNFFGENYNALKKAGDWSNV